jgi:hypothetical protein
MRQQLPVFVDGRRKLKAGEEGSVRLGDADFSD